MGEWVVSQLSFSLQPTTVLIVLMLGLRFLLSIDNIPRGFPQRPWPRASNTLKMVLNHRLSVDVGVKKGIRLIQS